MNKIIFVIFILASHFCGAQSKHPLAVEDTSDLYYKTLVKHLENVKGYSFIKASANQQYEVNIQESYQITENLPTVIGNFNLHYLETADIINKTQQEYQVFLLMLTPMKNKKDSIVIGLIDFFAHKQKKKSFYYSNNGSGEYKYRFNPIKNDFDLVDFRESSF